MTKKLPKFFPCKILFTYKEYHTSFIAERLLNDINKNNLDLVLSISINILSKLAYHVTKRCINENTFSHMVNLCRKVVIHSPGCININEL